MRAKPVNLSVFINCPFDEVYRELMWAIIFAVFDCGFKARCAEEIDDATQGRLQKILKLIKNCRFGIHDISMVKLDKVTKLPRFNMPFELGLFLAAAAYDPRQKRKACLILAHDKYNFRNCLSDISSRDVQTHKNDPKIAIKYVRNFLMHHTMRSIPGEGLIWRRYQKFRQKLPAVCRRLGLDMNELMFSDYVNLVLRWLKEISQPVKPPAANRARSMPRKNAAKRSVSYKSGSAIRNKKITRKISRLR